MANLSIANNTAYVIPNYEEDIIFNIVYVICFIAIIITAVIGNSLVCFAFFINASIRQSPTNYFIMSLAVSDILTVTLCIPFDVEQTLLSWKWNHGSFLCSLWTTIYLFVVPSSILSLLAVSVDRYKSLVDPLNRFRQSRFMTRKRACVVIAALWLYSLMFALLPEIGWNLYPENIINGSCYFNMRVEYSVLSSFLNFILPVIIMCGLYLRIYKIIRKMRRDRLKSAMSFVSDERKKGKERKRLQKNIKTTKNILIVVCTFFVCWIPYTLLTIISSLCITCYYSTPQQLFTIFLILGYSNSALNPYLYAFRNKKFKETFKSTLRSLNVLRDRKFSSRRSYANTNPSLISDSPSNARKRNVSMSNASNVNQNSSSV